MFSKRSGSKGKRHFRRRSTRHRRRTHKRKGGMMSSAASASASASKPEKRIAVWGPWKSMTNDKDYLSGKHFKIATDKTIADLKIAISEYISKRYEPGYELPALTKMKPYPNRHEYPPHFWVSDDTLIGHLGFDALKINLPPV